jgi:hypothetical protein
MKVLKQYKLIYYDKNKNELKYEILFETHIKIARVKANLRLATTSINDLHSIKAVRFNG